MKSLTSFLAKKRYDLTVFNHAACNAELLVINDIALSKIEKKWFECALRQCKDPIIGFNLHTSPRRLDSCCTLNEVLSKLEATSVLVKKTLTMKMNLIDTMTKQGFTCYTDKWDEGDGRTRVFIKVTCVADINNVMSIVAHEYPELVEPYFHIGNNCLWIFEDHLLYEKEVVESISLINRERTAKYMNIGM